MPNDVAPYSEAVTEAAKAIAKALDLIRDASKPISTTYGLVIGDRMEAWRERNLDAITRRTRSILKHRNLAETGPVAEQIGIQLLEAAQGETRPEMQELWATLLANAMDPDRRDDVRQEFITMLKQFHPTDALVLKMMCENFSIDNYVAPRSLNQLGELAGTRESSVAVSMRHLVSLTCLDGGPDAYRLTWFGMELFRACTP